MGCEISCQRNVDCVIMLVPRHLETTILGTGTIGGDFLLSAKHIYEVFGVFFYFLFDAKVINNKAESYGSPFMYKHTGRVLSLVVAWVIKVLHKTLVVQNSGLGKTIHALSNFYDNGATVNKRDNIIFVAWWCGRFTWKGWACICNGWGAFKGGSFRSAVMNRAPGVNIVMLRRH